MRQANERWAAYITRLVATRFGGRQSALAEALDMAPSSITRWIDGATPTIQNLRAMRERLGTPIVELLIEAGALSPEELGEPAMSSLPVDVMEAIRQDAELIDRARHHLLEQYEILREWSEPGDRTVSPLRTAARKGQPRKQP